MQKEIFDLEIQGQGQFPSWFLTRISIKSKVIATDKLSSPPRTLRVCATALSISSDRRVKRRRPMIRGELAVVIRSIAIVIWRW